MDTLHTISVGRECPTGARKHRGGGAATWTEVRTAVAAERRSRVVFRICGDVSGVEIDGPGVPMKYSFIRTGQWWRSKFDARHRTAPAATTTAPPFGLRRRGADSDFHVAVHVRRGDMVYRNFYMYVASKSYTSAQPVRR